MRSFAFAVAYWPLSILHTLAAAFAALTPGRGLVRGVIRSYVRSMAQTMERT